MTNIDTDRLARIFGPSAVHEVVTTVRSAPAELEDNGNTYFRDNGFELWFRHHVYLVAGFNITGAGRSRLSVPKLATPDQSAFIDREFSFHIGCKSYFESSLAIFPGWFDISPNEILLQNRQNFVGVLHGEHPNARLHLKLFFRRPVQ